MRAPDTRHRGPFSVTMTPMIDVVFLLIIFFLVSSHLAQRESHVPMSLPQADTGDVPQNSQPKVILQLAADGRLWANGVSIDVEHLQELLVSHQARFEQPIELRLRCDREHPYQRIEPILLSAARAGIWDVSFAVLPRKNAR